MENRKYNFFFGMRKIMMRKKSDNVYLVDVEFGFMMVMGKIIVNIC